MQMANEMGFDAVAFQLEGNESNFWKRLPLSRKGRFGLIEIWTDQICEILAEIPESKILYSFSGPSTAALLAMVRCDPLRLVKGWICDGGPFSQVGRCLWNLFTYESKTPNLLFRLMRTQLAFYLIGGGPSYQKLSERALKQLPNGFPILSLRAWEDKIVPMSAIEDFFALHDKLNLQVFSIPEIGHLQGLGRAPAEYQGRVESFLHKVATPYNGLSS